MFEGKSENVLSELLAQYIIKELEASHGTAEIQRNELAEAFGCVPSQINYVLTSRFTPERGYIVESRRGGGGCIRITRIQMDRTPALMHAIHSIGETIDLRSARAIICNLAAPGYLSAEASGLMLSVLSERSLLKCAPEDRAGIRAELMKNMLVTLLRSE